MDPKTLALRAVALAAALLAAHAVAPAQEPDAPPKQEPAPARPSGGADPSGDAFRFGSPAALADGLTEEAMWPAATAEGWQKPVLVKWQRTFDDALRAARERHSPLMVAVNMDGEIASEHFAGVRYRDAETAALLNRYACVIASVYRHTPRDYDENGERVPCPRFGTVTCGEHIEAERELYDKYFDGKRISPRHIMLDLEGAEQYDVYYSWDTATVFTAFRKGVEDWPLPNRRDDMALEDLTQSADIEHRERVEYLYRTGDRETKKRLLESVLHEPAVDQVELLRMALFGFDLELAHLARQALAECKTEGAIELMAEALKVPLDAEERERLIAAAAKLGETSHRARTLVTLHEGLGTDSALIDREGLERRRQEQLRSEYSGTSRAARAVLDVETDARAVEARPDDAAASLALAESFLLRAESDGNDPRMVPLYYADARRVALDAERAGARGPRLDAVLAVAAAELGDDATARMRAFSAVEGGILKDLATTGDSAGAGDGASESAHALGARLGERARVRLLLSFAEARQTAIRARYRAQAEWPGEWLSDVNSAYASIIGHPLVDAAVLADYHDFLRWIGASPRADAVLDDALRRFPDDATLHERLRSRLLWEEGPEGLDRGYDQRLAAEENALAAAALNGGLAAPTQITWYAGYAALVAAEHHRRRGEFDAALAAYGRAVERYEQNIARFPDGRDSADHFIALGLAGRARVALERRQFADATRAMLASFTRRPDSAASLDGLGITPVATAKMLMARLEDAGEAALATEVRDALDGLDPKLLEPPPTELPGAGRVPRRRR